MITAQSKNIGSRNMINVKSFESLKWNIYLLYLIRMVLKECFCRQMRILDGVDNTHVNVMSSCAKAVNYDHQSYYRAALA